jgi:hypothetical protein
MWDIEKRDSSMYDTVLLNDWHVIASASDEGVS